MQVCVVEPLLDQVAGAAERAAWRADLEAGFPEYAFAYLDRRADLRHHIAGCDVVAGFVEPEALAAAGPRLKWVHSWNAGPDRQLYPAFVERGLVLTCSKGNGAIPLAEQAIMLMLMLQRDAPAWLDAQRAHRWGRRFHGELNGLTLGILGIGHFGKDLARKARAFHMRVVGLGRSLRQEPGFDRIFAPGELMAFLAGLDFLVVTAPLTETTRGMLGAAEFAAMKPGAYYLCLSRGGIADDAALLAALRSGHLAGAGLDAHSVEPLPADSPFWDAPNTLVTPHNGATTKNTHVRGLEIFKENLRRFRQGLDLVNLVDQTGGY